MAKQLLNKHPLAIRWLHWINFPVLSMMIWSGLLIYWANAVYSCASVLSPQKDARPYPNLP